MRTLDLLHRWGGGLLGLTGAILVHKEEWIAPLHAGDARVADRLRRLMLSIMRRRSGLTAAGASVMDGLLVRGWTPTPQPHQEAIPASKHASPASAGSFNPKSPQSLIRVGLHQFRRRCPYQAFPVSFGTSDFRTKVNSAGADKGYGSQ